VACTGPQPDRIHDRCAFTERTSTPTLTTTVPSALDNAIQSLMVCANVSRKRATEVMTRHAEGKPDTSLLGESLRAAFQEIREAAEHNQALPKAAPPAVKNPFTAANTLSDSRDEFISHHLGNGTRAMTAQEIYKASKEQRREAFTGCPSAIIPKNLERFWAHHQNQTSSSPRGNQPHGHYQRRIAKQTYDALHQEACAAASLQQRDPAFAAPHAATVQSLPAPTLTTIMRQERYFEPDTPASARHPAVIASLQHPPGPAPVHEALVPIPPQQQPAPVSHPHPPTQQQAARPLVPHPSPQVRLAQEREKPRVPTTGEPSSNNLNITVDTGALPANSIIWKAGKESDGAGFNYHAYAGVKASWEQANADKTKGYRTIKSFIDPRFITTICDYVTGGDRPYYDTMPDSELFRLLEEKLRPTDSTVYFMKVNALKISLNPADGTLSARYSAFAEAFLATVNEAKEAGTPLRNEAVRHAFRTACNSNGLLRMYLGAEEWSTVQLAHQRIWSALQRHENHQLCASLGATPVNTAAPPMVQAPPPSTAPISAPLPPPQYTPEQKREYALAKQQRLFASQQHQQQLQQQQQQQLHQQQLHQQQVLVNSVQQQVDLALAARLNQAPATAAPPTPVYSNNTFQFPRQNTQSLLQNAPATPHPGLDSRGPFWHTNGPALACRSNPCQSTSFCQGCGTHGHCSADCRRRNHPGWNANGYYSDRYPGNGALPYATPKPPVQPYQFPQLPAPTSPLPPPQQFQQLRIAPPPLATPLVHPNPFPTPYKVNNVTRTSAAPMPALPTIQVNASTQLSSSQPDQTGSAAEGGQ
jgi:hypothetical protein